MWYTFIELTKGSQINVILLFVWSSLGVANGEYNAQTSSVSYKAVSNNAHLQAPTGPDYDEIKDELPYVEESSEKVHLDDKSVEFTKSSNDYFTLMLQEPQVENITNVMHF